MASLISLPLELLLEVFSTLDYVSLRVSLRRVCQHLRDVIDSNEERFAGITSFRQEYRIALNPSDPEPDTPSESARNIDTYCLELHPYIRLSLSRRFRIGQAAQNDDPPPPIPTSISKENALRVCQSGCVASKYLEEHPNPPGELAVCFAGANEPDEQRKILEPFLNTNVESFMCSLLGMNLDAIRLWFGLRQDCNLSCFKAVLRAATSRPGFRFLHMWELAYADDGHRYFGMSVRGFEQVSMFLVKAVSRSGDLGAARHDHEGAGKKSLC